VKSNFQIFSRLFFVVLLLSFFSGCSEETPGEDSRNGTSKTEAVVPVKVVALQSGELIESVTATGTTFPLHDAVLSAEVPGTVTRILLEVGQRVEPSQVLVKLDPELKQLAVEQAEAALLEAEAAFEKLSRDLERNEKLFASKDISEFIVENARLQKQSAEAAFLAAQANFKMANRQLRNADIKSPIAGLVAVRLVELGAAVAPGVPIAKVVDISKIKIKFSVAEKDITRMKVGQSLTVSLNAIPGEDFAGKVTAVAPQADLSSRTFQVEGLIDNPDARIKAGMIAKAGTQKGLPIACQRDRRAFGQRDIAPADAPAAVDIGQRRVKQGIG